LTQRAVDRARTPRRRGGRRGACGVALAAALAALSAARPARAQATDPTAPTPPPPAEPLPPPPPLPDTAAAEAEKAATAEALASLVDVFEDKNRVPVNPALDVLDANGLNVVKPGSVKDLGTDLRALYAGGRIVPQIAVELSPYALAFGHRTTYDDYLRRAYVPILHRLSVSIATTSVGAGDAQATVGAIGVRVRLIDRSDWRLDRAAVRCALDAATLAKPPSASGDLVVVPVDPEAGKKEAKQVKECFDRARKRVGTWNATQIALGGALSSAFPGGKLEADIRDLTGWAAWGEKLGRNGLLVVAAKYLFSDVRRDGDLRIPARHTASVATEAERRGDRFGVSGSIGVGRRWSNDLAAMEWVGAWVGQLGAGVQLRVSDASWVELRVSAQLVEDDDGAFVSLANLKWNFDVKPSKGK
jgi:hypothetical protein